MSYFSRTSQKDIIFSVHNVINSIRTWDINIKLFVSFNLFRRFDLINKNRLRNIFYFVLGDDLIWLGATALIFLKRLFYY